jgi:hypothetical protein
LVEQLFSHVSQLQRPPFHPKWQELAPLAQVAGWTRFKAAQDWVDRNAPVAASATEAPPAALGARASGSEDDPALYREFLEWRATRLKQQDPLPRPRRDR